MKNLFLAITMVFFGVIVKGQTTIYPMLTAGYQYQNSNFAELGGKLLFTNSDDVLFRLGASALMGEANDKFAILPKVQGDFLVNTQKNVDVHHAYYVLAGAEATTKYLSPKLGISLFGIVDITGGYAFPFNKANVNGKELKGLNFNFTINIPVVVFQK